MFGALDIHLGTSGPPFTRISCGLDASEEVFKTRYQLFKEVAVMAMIEYHGLECTSIALNPLFREVEAMIACSGQPSVASMA